MKNFEILTKTWILTILFEVKCRSFYCCLIAIYYFEIFLKNFGKWRHQGARVSYFSPRIFQKFCNFSVLKQVFSICTSFQNNWLKSWPDIRNLVFLLNKELYKKFALVLKVCQRWHHKWNIKTIITLDLDLNLADFSKSHIFGRCFT